MNAHHALPPYHSVSGLAGCTAAPPPAPVTGPDGGRGKRTGAVYGDLGEKVVKLMHKSAAPAVLAGAVVLGSGGAAFADAGATGVAANSPGVLSGNVIEVPIDLPINACGETVDIIAVLNPAAATACVNS
jgi:ChpA-C